MEPNNPCRHAVLARTAIPSWQMTIRAAKQKKHRHEASGIRAPTWIEAPAHTHN